MFIPGASSSNRSSGPVSWDLSTAVETGSPVSIDLQTTSIFFKPDGYYMYYVREDNYIYQRYLWENGPWELNASSDSIDSFTGSGYYQDYPTNIVGIFWSNDGQHLYLLGSDGGVTYVYHYYTPDKPWNMEIIHTTYEERIDISAQSSISIGVWFNPSLTKMYTCRRFQIQNEYDLSIAGDVSTAIYSNNSNTSTIGANTRNVLISSSGLTMFVISKVDGQIGQYDLSTAWDISTGTLGDTLTASEYSSIFVKASGDLMFVHDTNGGLRKFNMTPA